MTFLPQKADIGPALMAVLIAFPLSFGGVSAIIHMLEIGGRLAA
jgi:hypothetical protein